MDNQMIVDFINNVEPNFSYGSSDGMARAMVESAENMAIINDYIVESTYEVYTEADGDRSIFGKIKDKIHKYFILFVNLIKKAIEKVKGYFFTVKRKLTQAMAVFMKKLAKAFIHGADRAALNKASKKNTVDRISSFMITPTVDIGNTTLSTYEIDEQKYNELKNTIKTGMQSLVDAKDNDKKSMEDIEEAIKTYKLNFDNFIKSTTDTGSVLLKSVDHKLTFVAADANILEKEVNGIFKDVSATLDDFYNYIMKSYTKVLAMLKSEEVNAKSTFSNDPTGLSAALKRISNGIHTINYTKYKAGQLVASACLKMYKKTASEAWKLMWHPKDVKVNMQSKFVDLKKKNLMIK